MTARTQAPEEQLLEQLAEMAHSRAWYWLHRNKPLTSPGQYAKTAVARITEGLVSK